MLSIKEKLEEKCNSKLQDSALEGEKSWAAKITVRKAALADAGKRQPEAPGGMNIDEEADLDPGDYLINMLKKPKFHWQSLRRDWRLRKRRRLRQSLMKSARISPAQLYQWAEEYVKAQDFILGRVDRKSSLAAAAHSHQIGRLASVLAANGGWGKKFSKLLGHMAYSEVHPEILQEVQKAKPSQSNSGRPKKAAIYSSLFLRRTPIARNPDSYDANDFCIISGGGDAGVLKKFEQLYTPEDFQEKLDELQKAVTEGNPAWGGANTALDRSPEAQTIIEKLGFGFGSVDDGHVHDLAGSTANLHVVKTYSKRWGGIRGHLARATRPLEHALR